VISIFCSRIRAGQELVIHGDGSQTRDFVYVDDVVRALMLAMTLLPGDSPVMNVCTGAATSVLQLAAIIGALEGRPPFLRHAPRRAGDVRESLGDPTLAKASLGFEARTSLSDGLRRVIDAQARVPPRYPSAAQQPAMHPAP
jgi:UDP-glucose 4-epimerase